MKKVGTVIELLALDNDETAANKLALMEVRWPVAAQHLHHYYSHSHFTLHISHCATLKTTSPLIYFYPPSEEMEQ